MANKPLQSIKFPGLSDTYIVPQIDNTLTHSGQAADAKAAGDEIDELKSAISDTTGCTAIQLSDPSLHQYIQTNGGVGTTVQWDTPSTMGNAGAWAVVDCVEGDKFTISGKGGDADRLWCFLDAEKKIKRVAGSSTTSTNLILTARAGEVYLVINNRQDKTSYIGEIIPKSINNIITRLDNSLELDNSHAITLSSDSQVDSLIAGNYIVPNSTVASDIDMPVQAAGKLYCLYLNASNRILQIYFSTSRIFTRYNNGSWQAWQEVLSTDNIHNELNATMFLDTSVNTSIPANSDLDSYTTPGSFGCGSASTAETLSHCPIAVAFRMIVMDLAATNRKCQIIIPHSATNLRLFMRYNDGTWKDWIRCVLPNETIVSQNTVISNSSQLSSYNDAPLNSILAMNRPEIPNGPDGDSNLINVDSEPGYLRGTLITYTPQTGTITYKAQIFIGYYSSIANNSPIISYRFAISSSGVWTWSPWAKFSQNRFLGATNVVIRASTANLYFTDLNDAPINTIYQIDMDCVVGVLSNHPAPGYSAVLMTYAYALGTRHGMVQELYSLQSGRCVKYFRYGWLDSADDYRWTAWEKVLTETVS